MSGTVQRVKLAVLLAIIFSFLQVGNLFADGWIGVFTTDKFPMDGFRVTRVGTIITVSRYMRYYQKYDDFNDENNFLRQLSATQMNISDYLAEQARKGGWNAILGFRVVSSPLFNGFGSEVVNGMEGVGYAVVTATGVPVTVMKTGF